MKIRTPFFCVFGLSFFPLNPKGGGDNIHCGDDLISLRFLFLLTPKCIQRN